MRFAHIPALFTTYSHSISPDSVKTFDTLLFVVSIPLTLIFSMILAPLFFACFAKANVAKAGCICASFGIYKAPIRSFVSINGHISEASPGDIE